MTIGVFTLPYAGPRSSYQGEEEFRPGSPAEFIYIAEEVTLQELIDFMREGNATLYLPSQLPDGLEITLEITAVYLKRSPFVAVVVYDSQGNKDPATAELVIAISHQEPPTPEMLEHYSEVFEHILEINGWPVAITLRARVTRQRQIEKYGEYAPLALVWIDEINYSIGGDPNLLTLEQIEEKVKNSLGKIVMVASWEVNSPSLWG